MSFVKKLVEIVERSDNIDAHKNITKLNRDIKFHQEKIKQYIEANYDKFLPSIINNELLTLEGIKLKDELAKTRENLSDESKSLYQGNDEISKLIEELEVTSTKLNLSAKFMKIDKLLSSIKHLNEPEDINNALNNIQLLINDPEDKIIRRLGMYKSVKAKLLSERINLLNCLKSRFESFVNIKEKSFLKTRSITIRITKKNEELVKCLNSIMDSDYNFNSLTEFLVENVFEAIIDRAVSLEIEEKENDYTMSLSFSTEPVDDALRPNYGVVFNNVHKILSFLNKMNVELKTGEFFLSHVLQGRRKNLFDSIFHKCLVHSIPKTFEEKAKSTMNADIEELKNLFSELNIFPASTEDSNEDELEDYSLKIDELFYDRLTKNIEESASNLLKKDLHDMILISDDSTMSTRTPLSFPRCTISKSTLELVLLLEKIISQAKETTNNTDKLNIIKSINTVLGNYTFMVQLHHAKFLSQIPQQSALVYNNCMYLSKWATSDPEAETFRVEPAAGNLEKQGWEILECQIEKQKIQLIHILSDFDPTQSLNDFQPSHFKPIRQCLRQLDLLKNVWQTILPSKLYNQTIADLLDVISLDLIKKVTSMEDISTKLSNGLVEFIKLVDEKGQLLFDVDVSAVVAVPSWQKMLHLQFILEASLVDITNSWKAGQISQTFKVEEVKRLIRALFQNTDRRANALSCIV